MNLIKNIGYFFGWFWILPINILAWLFFFLPMYLKGTFENVDLYPNGMIVWDVKNTTKFYKKSMIGWYGFVIGTNIVLIDLIPGVHNKQFTHEKTHVLQNFIFGPLFYPIYILMSIILFVGFKNKHAYLDNPFERWARKKAKQKINIPKKEWTNGPNDRWPWC